MQNNPYGINADWPALPHIRALTTTRLGGVSQAPYDSLNLAVHVQDDINAVAINRQRLCQQLTLPQPPVWLNQIHSTITVDAAKVTGTPDADAAYTNQPNIVCAVLTADCLPLLVCDKAGTVVSAIHAGWRGLANGVIEASIKALPVNPADLLVWLGPALGPQAFKVGNDVVAAFTAIDPAAIKAFTAIDAQHWLGNLYQLAKMRLNKLGVTHIYGGNHCTYTEADLFYSFRRDNVCGRMASLIWMEKNE